jgi:hypothetical protein
MEPLCAWVTKTPAPQSTKVQKQPQVEAASAAAAASVPAFLPGPVRQDSAKSQIECANCDVQDYDAVANDLR